MKKIGFNFNKYRYDTTYPDIVWNHVLRRGSNADKWGFVTHSYDPISLTYFQYMSGNGDEGRKLSAGAEGSLDEMALSGRRTEDEDVESEWWGAISTSLSTVQNKHKNVDYYVIESEGKQTCSIPSEVISFG